MPAASTPLPDQLPPVVPVIFAVKFIEVVPLHTGGGVDHAAFPAAITWTFCVETDWHVPDPTV